MIKQALKLRADKVGPEHYEHEVFVPIYNRSVQLNRITEIDGRIGLSDGAFTLYVEQGWTIHVLPNWKGTP